MAEQGAHHERERPLPGFSKKIHGQNRKCVVVVAMPAGRLGPRRLGVMTGLAHGQSRNGPGDHDGLRGHSLCVAL